MPRTQQSKNWTISQIDGTHEVHPRAFHLAVGTVATVLDRFTLGDHHLYVAILPCHSVSSSENPFPRFCVPMPYMGAIAIASHSPEEDDETFIMAFTLSLMDSVIQWVHQVLGHEDVLDPYQLDSERSRLMWDILNTLPDV